MVVSVRGELPNLNQCLTNGKDPISDNSDYSCYVFIHSISIHPVIATVGMVITHNYSNLDLPQGPGYDTHGPEGWVDF